MLFRSQAPAPAAPGPQPPLAAPAAPAQEPAADAPLTADVIARLQEIDADLSLPIEEHADSTHVLLCGPGGVGKSTVLKGVTERFTREEPTGAVVPIVLLEPIPSDTGPYVRLDYYRQIVAALKGHILVKELYVNVAHLMIAPKSSRVRQVVIDLNVRRKMSVGRSGVEHSAQIFLT